MLNSPKTNILADRLIMRPLSLLDEIASKSMHKEDGVQQSKKKRKRHQMEVKPVKNCQSFL